MFCNQCEQTIQDRGCTQKGVCGKNHETASLQDLLTFAVRGLSQVAVVARKLAITDTDVNRFTLKAIFATLTNVNFDCDRLQALIEETVNQREAIRHKINGTNANYQIDERYKGSS